MRLKKVEWVDSSFDKDLTLSRRRVLLGIAAGAVVATLGLSKSRESVVNAAVEPAVGQEQGRINWVIAALVQPFSLFDVRLLEGPFLKAQQRDEKYILELEPDRMLHNFRVNAGLEPRAAVYAGWESVQEWADIRCHGHTLGHYLSACAMMFGSTGREAFKQRCDQIVSELQECQAAGKTGLVCAFPDNAMQFDNAVAGRKIVGVPWYTLHKILAGLRDVHLYCDSRAALEVLVKVCDWADTATAEMSDQQFQKMLNIEHGGMNEVLADVYEFTGDTKYLKLAERFCHRAVLDPLSQKRDTLTGLHSNTQIPKFIGFNRLYALTGKADYHSASVFFWQTVVHNRSFVTGGNADTEHFFAPAKFQQHLNSAKTMETCCSYNMLKLTRMLFAMDPAAHYADYYERTLYNSILASQDPESGMMTYYQATRPGYLKLYCTPTDSFWCCTGSGIENHAKYGDSIYFHSDNAIYVNLFIQSKLSWKEKGMVLEQTTMFPDEPITKLKLTVSSPATVAINIRHPAWCENVTVKVNGKQQSTSSTPGSYLTLNRQWSNGDTIEVSLPMTLRTEPLPGSTDTFAFIYGPIVLAATFGRDNIAPGADLIISERDYGKVLNHQIDVPTLVGDSASIIGQIKPVPGSPLAFTAPLPNRTDRLMLIPYFRVAHERYSMYLSIHA